MSRSVAWRRTCSDNVSWRQDQAGNATIYILRQTGPTGFLLKEEGETKKFKVNLGDPHSCTCPVFTKERDLCKHICWVILKKFRVPRQNDITWQLGLVEREINGILRGVLSQSEATPSAAARRLAAEAGTVGGGDGGEDQAAGGTVEQRPIANDDVCPICQEELMTKHLPVTYCRMGCGNSVHIKCMKVWAEHQNSTGQKVVKCPFCREDFGPISRIQQEYRNTSVRQTRADHLHQHLGVTCRRCNVCPIVGKCYKCIACRDFHLCQSCFGLPIHQEHSFEFREKTTQRWRPAQRGSGAGLPQAIVSNLMSRDITDQDYDLLLQLDGSGEHTGSELTDETVKSMPLERVRANSRLLLPGIQCRVCLSAYSVGHFVRRLPCNHKFHRDCIDNWLLHQHARCPIDGTVFTNQSVRAIYQANRNRARHESNDSATNQRSTTTGRQPEVNLEIPGVGFARHPQHHQPADNTAPAQQQASPAQRVARPAHPRSKPRSADNVQQVINLDGILQGSMMTLENNNAACLQNNSPQRTSQGRRLTSLTDTLEPDGMYTEGPTPEGAIRIPTAAGQQRKRSPVKLQFGRHRPQDPSYAEHDDPGSGITVRPARTWSNPSSRRGSLESQTGGVLSTRTLAQDSFVNHISMLQAANPVEEFTAEVTILNNDTLDSGFSSVDSRHESQSAHSQKSADSALTGLTAMSLLGDVGSISKRQGKPPVGNVAGMRKGKLRSKPLGQSAAAPNQTEADGMYVGYNPQSSSGMAANFMTQLKETGSRWQKPPRPRRIRGADQGHRKWGEVQEYQGDGNQLVLAGNKLAQEHNEY